MSIIEQQTTAQQEAKKAVILSVLDRYKHSPNLNKLSEELRGLGFTIVNRRVTWSGGIGSCKLMRGGVLRIQVRASTWGYKEVRQRGGRNIYISANRSFGYKYAPCVEVDAVGCGVFSSYYNSGHQNIKRATTIQEQHYKTRKRIYSHL